MSDIEKINISTPIDHGGITLGNPSAITEGRNSQYSSQFLASQSLFLLNRFKKSRTGSDLENTLYATLFAIQNNGLLGIYQADLQYPSATTYNLVSQIDLGFSTFIPLTIYSNHYVFSFNNNIYATFGSNNLVKLNPSNFETSVIDIGGRCECLTPISNNILASFVDNKVYLINLETNIASLYGSINNISYPIESAVFNTTLNKLVVISDGNIYIINFSDLSVDSSINSITTYNKIYDDLYSDENAIYIYGSGLNTLRLDNNGLSDEYVDTQYWNIDLFGLYKNNTLGQIFVNNQLLGTMTDRPLFIDHITDVYIAIDTTGKRSVYSLSGAFANKSYKLLTID